MTKEHTYDLLYWCNSILCSSKALIRKGVTPDQVYQAEDKYWLAKHVTQAGKPHQLTQDTERG